MTNASWNVAVNSLTIDGVQSVTINYGRKNLTDAFRAGNVTVTGIDPDSLPTIRVGDSMTVTMTYRSVSVAFQYQVRDLRIDYGIVPNQDVWELIGEDSLAFVGRAIADVSWSAGANSYTTAVAVANAVGVTLVNPTALSSSSTLSAQTLNDANILSVLQKLANTDNAILDAAGFNIAWLPRNWQSVVAPYYNLTDDGTGTKPIVFSGLSFSALADSGVTQVVVRPVGLADQSAGSGTNAYELETYNASTSDALSLAQYLLGSLSVDEPVPFQVSSSVNAQTNNGIMDTLTVGTGVNVTFRGSTYKSLVLGVTISANPSQTRVTWDLVSSEFYRFLTLNDATLGKLDENKLGW